MRAPTQARMASGDVVNTAARLQSAAPVNGVIADETTYRATRNMIDYDGAEPVEAKEVRANRRLEGARGACTLRRRHRTRGALGAGRT